jgi:hypothetical protein
MASISSGVVSSMVAPSNVGVDQTGSSMRPVNERVQLLLPDC